jgi:hypothetical protein
MEEVTGPPSAARPLSEDFDPDDIGGAISRASPARTLRAFL